MKILLSSKKNHYLLKILLFQFKFFALKKLKFWGAKEGAVADRESVQKDKSES